MEAELPALYQSARVFLFPTHGDVWGIVANEACAAGLPVLATPQAGVAGELVIEGRNGHVRERRVDEWASCTVRLLSDEGAWRACSRYGLQRVQRYSFDGAAQGITEACRIAAGVHEASGIAPAMQPAGTARPAASQSTASQPAAADARLQHKRERSSG